MFLYLYDLFIYYYTATILILYFMKGMLYHGSTLKYDIRETFANLLITSPIYLPIILFPYSRDIIQGNFTDSI